MKHIANNRLDPEEENVSIQTKAQLVNSEIVKKGVLILTKKKLVFNDRDNSFFQEFELSRVKNIQFSKKWGLFKNGIQMIYDNGKYTLKVDFPTDWLRMIKCQIANDI